MPEIPALARLYDPKTHYLVAAEGQPVEQARVPELLTEEQVHALQREEPSYRSQMVGRVPAEPTEPAPADDDGDGVPGGPGVDVQEPEPTTAKRTRVRTRMAPQGENRMASRGGA